jgi:hypothetical protein
VAGSVKDPPRRSASADGSRLHRGRVTRRSHLLMVASEKCRSSFSDRRVLTRAIREPRRILCAWTSSGGSFILCFLRRRS